MVVLGILFGVGLAAASQVFRVVQDERIELILEALPGVNCGACAYGGCRAYAEAVVNGEKVGLCTLGGQEVTDRLAAIMGVEAVSAVQRRAVVHCQGGLGRCEQRCDYEGIEDCRAAHLLSGGPKACVYGCLGLGTCADACLFGAITMNEERLPVVDLEKCTACGICMRVCPRGLISLLEARYKAYLGCSSRGRGKSVKSICSVGCITCGLCAKKEPHGAIVIENNLPVLDYEKGAGHFAVAADVCPMNCFVVEEPELSAVGAQEAAADGAS